MDTQGTIVLCLGLFMSLCVCAFLCDYVGSHVPSLAWTKGACTAETVGKGDKQHKPLTFPRTVCVQFARNSFGKKGPVPEACQSS